MHSRQTEVKNAVESATQSKVTYILLLIILLERVDLSKLGFLRPECLEHSEHKRIVHIDLKFCLDVECRSWSWRFSGECILNADVPPRILSKEHGGSGTSLDKSK